MRPRYPIYVPSKGRWNPHRQMTINALLRDKVPFWVVLEPRRDRQHPYENWVGRERILTLPEDEYGLLQTRNWIRDHAEAAGFARHWQLDDNIKEFRRLWRGRRIPCDAGVALRVCEDLSDRYENVALSGLNYQMFVPAETPVPFYRNVHVYSCTLVNHAAPFRWRLRYNDDTDICLQALATGEWCTLLVNAFMANKRRTMELSGGNTSDLYGGGSDSNTEQRLQMALALEAAWPDYVKTRWRFGRAQHSVRWDAFKQPLRRRPDVDLAALPETDEYGLELRAKGRVRSPALRDLLAAYTDPVPEAPEPRAV